MNLDQAKKIQEKLDAYEVSIYPHEIIAGGFSVGIYDADQDFTFNYGDYWEVVKEFGLTN